MKATGWPTVEQLVNSLVIRPNEFHWHIHPYTHENWDTVHTHTHLGTLAALKGPSWGQRNQWSGECVWPVCVCGWNGAQTSPLQRIFGARRSQCVCLRKRGREKKASNWRRRSMSITGKLLSCAGAIKPWTKEAHIATHASETIDTLNALERLFAHWRKWSSIQNWCDDDDNIYNPQYNPIIINNNVCTLHNCT